MLTKIKRLALLSAPVAAIGSMVAMNAHAQLIPSASSTAMLTTVSGNIWDVFYTNFPLIIGVVVLFAIVIGGASWLLNQIKGIGKKR